MAFCHLCRGEHHKDAVLAFQARVCPAAVRVGDECRTADGDVLEEQAVLGRVLQVVDNCAKSLAVSERPAIDSASVRASGSRLLVRNTLPDWRLSMEDLLCHLVLVAVPGLHHVNLLAMHGSIQGTQGSRS